MPLYFIYLSREHSVYLDADEKKNKSIWQVKNDCWHTNDPFTLTLLIKEQNAARCWLKSKFNTKDRLLVNHSNRNWFSAQRLLRTAGCPGCPKASLLTARTDTWGCHAVGIPAADVLLLCWWSDRGSFNWAILNLVRWCWFRWMMFYCCAGGLMGAELQLTNFELGKVVLV